ncbi:MAG: beta-propeller domain-containing protein, partial [Acholeplasmataceae bacterium]|nr:beta-propeller domain-containing protein [Acholeplasmataceae bacterium]
PGESVKSVRFSGHFAYVVTFRQIDPLYTIDISEPTLPIITNEIEEEGYSTYLHVWDQHHLIGLGLSADPFGVVTGMKLSAYSDDDKTEPLTTFFINDLDEDGKYSYGYSEAIHNHKAIMVSPSHGIFAFPVMVWHYWYESGQYHYGYLSYYMVFFIDFEATEPSDIISSPIIIEHDVSETYNQVDRGIYIDGIVYTFSFHQMVSYDLETDTVFENYFYDE